MALRLAGSLDYTSEVTLTGTQTLTNKTFIAPVLGVASATSLATSAATPFLLTNGQLVNIALTSQTVGATTLTIPNFANVSDTFTFNTLAATLVNKTLTSPTINGTIATTGLTLPAFTLGGTITGNMTLAGSLSLNIGGINGELNHANTTSSKVYTFPDATGTVALLGLAQTWSATQTFTAPVINGIVTTTGLTLPATTLGGILQIGAYYIGYDGTASEGLSIDTNGGVTIIGPNVTSPFVALKLSIAASSAIDRGSAIDFYNAAVQMCRIAGLYEDNVSSKTAIRFSTHTGAALTEKWRIDDVGNFVGLIAAAVIKINSVQVVGARVVDARCDDAINTGDATSDGVIDALRDAMITHGLIAAA